MPNEPRNVSEKITLYSQNFGRGYDVAVADGGYDQIAARNFLLEKLATTDAEWFMMNDADGLYHIDYYSFVSDECTAADVVTCSCFTLRSGPETIVHFLEANNEIFS